MSDDVSHGLQALGLAEVDALGVLEVADELHEVEGVDVEGVQGGVLGDDLRVDAQVLLQNLLDGVDGGHDVPFLIGAACSGRIQRNSLAPSPLPARRAAH